MGFYYMKIEKIVLENFRNYKNVEVGLDSNLILIVGENASGKTNFLESLYFLSNLKSFRAPDAMLVNHNEEHFSIKGLVSNEELETVVQKIPAVRRAFKFNGQKIKKIAWNTFKTVLFVPTDLNMFILGPDSRRKFLNEILSEKETVYSLDLASLEHILKQRSALLEKIQTRQAEVSELDFWNNELSLVAVRISRARRDFLEYVNDKFNFIYSKLTGFNNNWQVAYKGLESGVGESEFVAKLEQHLDAEVGSGMNLIGPHRDDFIITKDGVQNVYNSSRGELREQILALKILQAEYITVADNKPIILLDDVFSELDEQRREKLFDVLSGNQIFITTTEEHHLPKLNIHKTLLVKNNTIVEQ